MEHSVHPPFSPHALKDWQDNPQGRKDFMKMMESEVTLVYREIKPDYPRLVTVDLFVHGPVRPDPHGIPAAFPVPPRADLRNSIWHDVPALNPYVTRVDSMPPFVGSDTASTACPLPEYASPASLSERPSAQSKQMPRRLETRLGHIGTNGQH